MKAKRVPATEGRFLRFYRSTFGLALLGSVLLWASLPPLELGPLAWIAPVPWLLLIRRKKLEGDTPFPIRWWALISAIWFGAALAWGWVFDEAWVNLVYLLVGMLFVVPVFWLADERHPYRALWFAGLLFWLASLQWLRLPHWATGFGWAAMSLYFAFYLPVFVALGRVAVHRLKVPVIVAAPVIWTGLELARAHLLSGFIMAALGHTQYRWTALIQVSDLVGAYGVSFLVMFVAACVARMIAADPPDPTSLPPGERRGSRVAWWPLAPAAIAVGGALVYGYLRMAAAEPEPQARIALIQESIDTELKFDPTMRDRVHDRYLKLSEQAIREHGKVDLVVWPETMFRESLIDYDPDARPPAGWTHSESEFRYALESEAPKRRQAMGAIARELDTALLVGVDTEHYTARGPQFLNSAALVSRSGELLGRYDKVHLVLFGEYVPYADRWPWLQRFTPLSVSCTPGRGPAAFDLGPLRIAPNICYESVMPHVIRSQIAELIRAGREPDVLVNLTNDGWFWGSPELDMHLACGAFRAVECRKPFLIAANTGFSAWIDGDGRVRAQGPRRDVGTVLASVGRDGRSSWYLRGGDWFAGACLAACLVPMAVGLWGRKFRGRSGAR